MARFRYLSASREVLKGALLIFCVYGGTDYSQPREWIDFVNKLAGGSHIYITQIGLYMTVITLLLSYCVKHMGALAFKEVYRDFISVTLPMEALVTTVFWTLNFINPTLLKNREFYMAGIRTPLICEVSLHLFPFLVLLIDQVGVDIYEKKRHYLFFGIFGIVYFIVIHHFQKLNDYWVYPFLGYMTMLMRAVFVFVAILLVICYYKLFMLLSKVTNTRMYPKTLKKKLL
ncbi:FAR-17a/AIG1-like protein [Encephalitozoon hellem]|nr:FAR-17a/AIG1-like protein [Encephalitozoon hellem]